MQYENPCRRVWSSQLISLLLRLKPSYNNISDLVKLVFHQYCQEKEAASKSRITYLVSYESYTFVRIIPLKSQQQPFQTYYKKSKSPSSNDMTDNARIHQQSLKFSLTSGVTIYNFPGYQLINTLKKQEKMFKA